MELETIIGPSFSACTGTVDLKIELIKALCLAFLGWSWPLFKEVACKKQTLNQNPFSLVAISGTFPVTFCDSPHLAQGLTATQNIRSEESSVSNSFGFYARHSPGNETDAQVDHLCSHSLRGGEWVDP